MTTPTPTTEQENRRPEPAVGTRRPGAAASAGGNTSVPKCAWVGITAVSVALVALLIKIYPTPFSSSSQQRLFTVEELASYNATDDALPILLGILGSVFDVTKGKSHYGVGGGYHHFAGSLAMLPWSTQRRLPSICFRKLYRRGTHRLLRGLSSSEVKSVVDWRDFYFRSYTYVGKLVGRYYDSQGNPTKYLKGVEAKAARGAQLLEKQKKEEAKQPSCNSRWSQDEGGQVWCDVGFPRLVQRPQEIALTGTMSKRCACFTEDQLHNPGLEVYQGCDYLAKTCRV